MYVWRIYILTDVGKNGSRWNGMGWGYLGEGGFLLSCWMVDFGEDVDEREIERCVIDGSRLFIYLLPPFELKSEKG